MQSIWRLVGTLPYLAVVFLNAFVDLGHKITIQNTIFKLYDGREQVILTALVNALILLPFILLFTPAGWISDRQPKNRVMQWASAAALLLSLLITACYYLGWFWPAFAMTFLLAMQSAVYSPAKYGYIKHLFGRDHLAEGNGLAQSVTIVAILSGTFAFSILFEGNYPTSASNEAEVLQAVAPLGWLLVAVSAVQWLCSLRLPLLEPAGESLAAMRAATAKMSLRGSLSPLLRNRVIRYAVVGLAVFWSVGQVLLAAFPAYIKDSQAVDNTIIIQGLLACTGLGIAIGSALAARLSRGYIETGLIPLGAAGILLGLFLLTRLDSVFTHGCNLLFIGIMGGLFIVPLNALIQFNAGDRQLGSVLAGNNLFQNISMLLFLMLTALFAIVGFSSYSLLQLVTLFAVVGCLLTLYRLPQSLVRLLLSILLTRHHRIDVQGLKNLPNQGGVLLLGNHISWFDWAIIQIAVPRPVHFVMRQSNYQRWYLKWLFKRLGARPLKQNQLVPATMQWIGRQLAKGEVVCLFPEGSISQTGHITEFQRDFETIRNYTDRDYQIVPFYLRGLSGEQFSRASERLLSLRQQGRYRELIVAFGETLPADTSADILKRRVFDISIDCWQQHVADLPTLPAAWIDTVKRQGSEMAIADTLAEPLSATQALTGSILIARRIRTRIPEANVAVLLPTSAAGMVTNMAILISGKTVVNLNYTASLEALNAALEQAAIGTALTSDRFLDKLAERGMDLSSLQQRCRFVRLESLAEEFTLAEKTLTWLLVRLLPTRLLQTLYAPVSDNTDTAAILFSSGSEGAPKGVMLSHRNIMANMKQIADVLNTRNDDAVMAALPLFHAFGLTVMQFMPLIEGIPTICHADPTDTTGVARAIAQYRATILCGTSSLFRLYLQNRKIQPLMLESLRVVVAGAEKLQDDVRLEFERRFNKPVYQGYGATETTPVASVNLPDALDNRFWHIQQGHKPGTVGMPLPGTSFKIVDPDSLQELPTGEAGLILIGGSQVMRGYLNAPEKTAEVIVEQDGVRWYKTGDKGMLDEDGFLTIIDRYSRFAKIAGEMISLGAIEQTLRKQLDVEIDILAVNLPDAKKNEQIVLLSTQTLDKQQCNRQLQADGMPSLALPARYFTVDEIPKLGSGKVDFARAREIAQSLL